MTTSNITFPLELVEAFVEQLAPGSGTILEDELFQTVIACTLASKYFSFAARKRLFSALIIDSQPRHLLQKTTLRSQPRTEEEISRRINSFLNLLADERSSDLALMVRSLHIIVDTERVILQQAANLRGLLRSLSHRAHSLSILGVYGRKWFSWTMIPQETADGLQALCRSLPVNRLIFSGVQDIPPIIASGQEGPHLRYIDFTGSNFGKVETGIAAGSNISPARIVMSGNSEVLSSLPRDGRYEICYTSDGRTHIVGINISILSNDDGQPLNRLLCDERVRSSLRYCCCTFIGMYTPLLTTMSIDFGTMGLLRQLAIERRIGLYQRHDERFEAITDAMKTFIHWLYYGNTRSGLQEIKVTLSVERIWYRGENMFDSVDFSSLQRLRIDSLRKKHPLIQSTQFCMNIGLMQDHSGPEVQPLVEEIIRKLITDAITLPPVDKSLLPKIHICAKMGY